MQGAYSIGIGCMQAPAVTLGFSVHRPGAPQTLVWEQVAIGLVACLHVWHVSTYGAYGVMHSASDVDGSRSLWFKHSANKQILEDVANILMDLQST